MHSARSACKKMNSNDDKGLRAGLWWLSSMAELLVATGSDADSGVAGGALRFPSLSPLCFFVLSSTTPSSSSSSVFSLLSLFPSLCSPFSSLPPLSGLFSFFSTFFLSALPCIYRKTGEGNVLGRPLLAAPSTTFQQIKSQASG